MQGRIRPHVRLVPVLLAGLLLVLGAASPGGAEPPDLGSLREKGASLEAQSRSAVVELYALESRLEQARGDLAAIEARSAELARVQASAERRFLAARRTMAVAQRRLGQQLRFLYEQGEPDPFAVVLGATSLAEALEGLESLSRTARATDDILEQAKTAKRRLTTLRGELASRADNVARARAQAEQTAAGLESARSERSAYVARLRSELELTRSQISSLERQAREAEQRSRQVAQEAAAAPAPAPESPAAPEPSETTPSTAATPSTAEPEPGPSEPAPSPVESVSDAAAAPPPTIRPPRAGDTMVVVATMYCLRGGTATGLPVGPGIVAVDPAVIPLGTRMTIPGYGEGVAADVGGAIKGNRIDLWVASCAQASAYGQRTLRITFN